MKRLLVLFILLSAFCVLPSFVLADTCACWCESSGGAYENGESEDVAACQDACDDYLGCYTEDQSDLEPQYNTMCWTQYECETSTETGELEGEWEGQATNCLPGEGRCYSEPEAVSLNVAIGSFTESDSLGDYINAAYSWVLTAGSLLAIVIIMLGGLQYMLARGKPEKVGKAKTRIKNAVVGIILLFATYAIANLVDPSFTTFNRLSPPKIRTIVFLDPSSTCEVMEEAGLNITADTDACGDTGIVDGFREGFEDVQTSITDGTECIWSTCYEDDGETEDPMETCMSSTESATGYECVRCGFAHSQGVTPSDSACESLLASDPEPDDDDLYYCEYDPGLFDLGVSYTACVELVYPEEGNSLDCDQLRQDAEDGDSESCRAYDLVLATYLDPELLDVGEQELEYEPIDDIESGDENYPWLEEICINDPCGLAPEGEQCAVFQLDLDGEAAVIVTVLGVPGIVITGGAAIPVVAALATAAGFAGDELIVNCANSESSGYGLMDCRDEDGEDVDCNPTW